MFKKTPLRFQTVVWHKWPQIVVKSNMFKKIPLRLNISNCSVAQNWSKFNAKSMLFTIRWTTCFERTLRGLRGIANLAWREHNSLPAGKSFGSQLGFSNFFLILNQFRLTWVDRTTQPLWQLTAPGSSVPLMITPIEILVNAVVTKEAVVWKTVRDECKWYQDQCRSQHVTCCIWSHHNVALIVVPLVHNVCLYLIQWIKKI